MVELAVMQPTYIPWIGYFDLIDQADIFVFYDDVKVSKQSWGVRNRINLAGKEHFLTVPLKNYQNHNDRLFSNTEIAYTTKWNIKHLKTLQQAYSKAPFFECIFNDVRALIIDNVYGSIGDLNMAIISHISDKCGIETPFIKSSEIQGLEGTKDKRLVNICKKLNAENYLSTPGSAVYIEAETPGGAFRKNDINLRYHKYISPKYPQLGGQFLNQLSILDLLFNCGYDDALALIKSGRQAGMQ